jgi:hypothetical protein
VIINPKQISRRARRLFLWNCSRMLEIGLTTFNS